MDLNTINAIILNILIIGLITSAFMAVYLNEVTYSIGALGCTLIILAIIYMSQPYYAIYAAIFQLAIGASALGVLFLSGEMIGKKTEGAQSRKRVVAAALLGILISLPSLFFTVSISPVTSLTGSFMEDIWNFQSIDVVLQGLVILVIAMGIAIILYERRKKGE